MSEVESASRTWIETTKTYAVKCSICGVIEFCGYDFQRASKESERHAARCPYGEGI